MSQPISWTDLANSSHRIGVWGLGVEGRANVARLGQLGVVPVIVDDKPTAPHTDAGIPILTTDAGGLDALGQCNIVIKAPGISSHRSDVIGLQQRGVRLVSGLGLWLADADPQRVITVTGTKGKSTTTSILDHLAQGLGLRTFLGGNIGIPPWDPALSSDGNPVDLWIIEVSSYQATSLEVSAAISVVTSLAPDHLPWHGNEAQYYRDKLSMTTRPNAELTIASGVDANLHHHVNELGRQLRWVDMDTYPPTWTNGLGLLGAHNHVNANLARAALEAFCDLTNSWPQGTDRQHVDELFVIATTGFAGLAHRLERLGVIGDVEFIDDGLSTNVLPTLAAVSAFADRRVALIAGGFDRELDYLPLAQGLTSHNAPLHVVTMYTTGPAIKAAVESVMDAAPQVTTSAAVDLSDAVQQAYAFAQPDGVVLLSPAAASFDAFRDYAHRSDVFRQAVTALQQANASS